MLQKYDIKAERACSSFWNEPEEAQLADLTAAPTPPTLTGQVTFDHVRFATPRTRHPRLASCTVQPGQKVAIVGPTGAARSPWLLSADALYDVDAGSITLNGHNVRDLTAAPQRKAGMVLQDMAVQGHHHGEYPLRPAGRH